MHLAFVSPHRPTLLLDRWNDRADLLILGFSDLCFTTAESEEFLRLEHAGFDARQVHKFRVAAGGLATALSIASLSLRSRVPAISA